MQKEENTTNAENTINAENTDAAKTENAVEAVKDSTDGSPKREETAAQTENADVKEEAQSVPAVQEVDTASINAAEQDATPQPKRRQRPKRKGRSVAGQVSRLKLALLFLAPLLRQSGQNWRRFWYLPVSGAAWLICPENMRRSICGDCCSWNW